MERPYAGLRRRIAPEASDSEYPAAALPPQGPRSLRKRKGFAVSKVKKPLKASSTITEQSQGEEKGRSNCKLDDDFQDLALPLGMSFAAVLSQVFTGKIVSKDQLPAEKLSTICTSAVKESLSNIHGDKFDSFMRNFEKSFDSTLKTLLVFEKTSTFAQKNKLREEISSNVEGEKFIYESYHDEQGSRSCSSSGSIIRDIERIPRTLNPLTYEERPPEHESLSSANELALCGKFNRELVRASCSSIASGFSNSIMTTFEKSVTEQTRLNDLKEVEIGLTMRKLQMKQSQLAMNSYANWLEKVKICMNVSKAAFKEEKLRNQMQDSRHAEFVRMCIDLLVTGLILMCTFLIYGAWIYSYQRIAEVTKSCAATPRESKSSWWMPKQVQSFNSGWQILRCHALVVSRMLFGFLMILVIAYSLLRRSAVSGPAMPITSILVLLGFACGVAGKVCVDSLGGSGYHWLIHWEVLCSIHLFANLFPSIFYHLLYGRVLVGKADRTRYWIRRFAFYGLLLLVLPAAAGLLPFASMNDWKDHFGEKIRVLVSKAEERLHYIRH